MITNFDCTKTELKIWQLGFEWLFYLTPVNITCIRDLDKLNIDLKFDFILEPIFTIAIAIRNNVSHFKNGQKLFSLFSKG